MYPLPAKSDFYGVCLQFHAFICNQFSRHIKIFQSDGDTEFTSCRVRDFMLSHEILHHFSCPHALQQNGWVARKYRHIRDEFIHVCALTLSGMTLLLLLCSLLIGSLLLSCLISPSLSSYLAAPRIMRHINVLISIINI